MAFHATQGPVLGLPQMIQSRAQFGYRGVLLPLIGTLFTFVGFNVVDVVIIKSGLESIFGWNPVVVAVVITVIAALVAIFGHDLLHKSFRVLFWISLPLWIVLTCGVLFGGVTGTATTPGGFTFVAFLVQFSVAASYNITYAPYVSDYSRYLPRNTKPSAIIASVFLGASASPAWLIPLGAWMATYLGASDALAGINQTGNDVFSYLGSVLAVVSTLVLVATMGLNAYSGMLTVVTGLDSLRSVTPTRNLRVVTIAVLAVAWLVMSLLLSERDHGAEHHAADHAVPARALDRGQPDRLLLRPPRPLRDRRPVHPQRNLRRLVMARTDRLPAGVARRDPVRRPAVLRRTRRRPHSARSTSRSSSACWSPAWCTSRSPDRWTCPANSPSIDSKEIS